MKTKSALFVTLILIICTIASCKKKDPEPSPYPYATFKINSSSISYYNWNFFGKDFCPYSTYCGGFYYYDNQSEINRIDIGIPGDPIVGHTYRSGENRFKFFYFDNIGTTYTEEYGNFSLTFTRWDGQGGWCNANFSGWLKNRDNLADSVYVDQGLLQGKVWTFAGTK